MATTQRGLTLEEFLQLPEAEPALEYLNGTVTQKVAPKVHHGRLQQLLSEYIRRYAEPRGLAIPFTETRSTFAGSSPVPDVAVYRWERIPLQPGGEFIEDLYEPPDIAIEMLSPEQHRADLIAKCEWYVAHGAALALLVDPDDRSVMAFRPGEAPVVLYGADAIDFAPVLPGLQLRVRTLFGWLRPRRPRRQP